MDSSNQFLVGVNGDGEVVINGLPLRPRLTSEQVVNLMAWLAITADPGLVKVTALIEQITET